MSAYLLCCLGRTLPSVLCGRFCGRTQWALSLIVCACSLSSQGAPPAASLVLSELLSHLPIKGLASVPYLSLTRPCSSFLVGSNAAACPISKCLSAFGHLHLLCNVCVFYYVTCMCVCLCVLLCKYVCVAQASLKPIMTLTFLYFCFHLLSSGIFACTTIPGFICFWKLNP